MRFQKFPDSCGHGVDNNYANLHVHHAFLYVDFFSVVAQIGHFTVTGQNKVGVDLVLIQPFLLSYKNHAVVMLTRYYFVSVAVIFMPSSKNCN